MIARNRDKEKKGGGCYLSTAFGALIVILIVKFFWPDVIPFTLGQFLKLDGSILEIVKASWPLFAWGTGVTALTAFLTRNKWEVNRHAELLLAGGGIVSLWAGVVEEICFRWLIFYDEIVGYKIINWLIFGWAGFGVAEWIFLHITGPIANFLTLGYLSPILFNGLGWAVGAAILSSNGKFRNGHMYQGLFGWINSWFIGMFMFFLMFQYGLFASMVIHFLYDLFIFIVLYIDAAIERALGWGTD